MDPGVVLAVIGSSTFSAIVVSIVNGLINRRKLGAEATEIITRAASGIVERLQEEVLTLTKTTAQCQKTIVTLQAEVRALEDAAEEQRQVNQTHVAWDFLAYRELEEYGSHIIPPPPLIPPPVIHRA